MPTKEESRLVILLYGYIRLFIEINQDLNIPDSIKQLCLSFISLYIDINFEWNPYRGGFEKDTIIEDTKISTKQFIDDHRIVLSKNIISMKKYQKYEWEVTLVSWGDDMFGTLFDMGYIDIPIEKTVKRYEIGMRDDYETSKYHHKIMILKLGSFSYINCYNKTITEVASPEIKEGDRFRLVFDFRTRAATLYYNDKQLRVVFKDLPDEFVPAVSLEKCIINCSMFRGCICLD